MRVVFMGTPDFAVPSLEALVRLGHDVAGVFTQPDRPKGRGHKMAFSPVKQAALRLGSPVFQPERIKRGRWVECLRNLAPDIVVTAAFGQILSQEILDIPPLGTVNVHASLLPGYRGPAPIQWALYHGEEKTGVTTMYTDIGIDTGDMILKREINILPEDTARSLTERLSLLGAQALEETLALIERGDAPRVPQDERLASYYPMPDPCMCAIDWARSAREIVNQVRAADGAVCQIGGNPIKVCCAAVCEGEGAPGEVLCADGKRGLCVAAGDGAVFIRQMQAPGSRRMDSKDYLRGHSLPVCKKTDKTACDG